MKTFLIQTLLMFFGPAVNKTAVSLSLTSNEPALYAALCENILQDVLISLSSNTETHRLVKRVGKDTNCFRM